MKILVTGAAGFIGFHVVRRLLLQGYEVAGLDNINSYYDVRLKFARLNETGISREKIKKGKWIQSDKFQHYKFIQFDLIEGKKNFPPFSVTRDSHMF